MSRTANIGTHSWIRKVHFLHRDIYYRQPKSIFSDVGISSLFYIKMCMMLQIEPVNIHLYHMASFALLKSWNSALFSTDEVKELKSPDREKSKRKLFYLSHLTPVSKYWFRGFLLPLYIFPSISERKILLI